MDESPEAANGGGRRVLVVLAGLVPVLLGTGLIAAAVLIFAGQGEGSVGDADVAAAMRRAGCTLQTFPAQKGTHLQDFETRPRYNSFPPTSGPHYFAPVAWGFWGGPLEQVQMIHNLEHGGIVIQYGDKVPLGSPSRPSKLVEFFASEFPGLIVMAPLAKLGKTITLAAWTAPEPGARRTDYGTGHLAKCPRVDEDAFRAFVDAYQNKGPEGAQGGRKAPVR